MKWIMLSVSREENSSGLFIGVVYLVWMQTVCPWFYFLFSFFSIVITFPHPASFPLYLPVSPKHHSLPYNLILQKECLSVMSPWAPHTILSFLCSDLSEVFFSIFTLTVDFLLLEGQVYGHFFSYSLLLSSFPKPSSAPPPHLSSTTLRDSTAENRHFFLYLTGSLKFVVLYEL